MEWDGREWIAMLVQSYACAYLCYVMYKYASTACQLYAISTCIHVMLDLCRCLWNVKWSAIFSLSLSLSLSISLSLPPSLSLSPACTQKHLMIFSSWPQFLPSNHLMEPTIPVHRHWCIDQNYSIKGTTHVVIFGNPPSLYCTLSWPISIIKIPGQYRNTR